MFGFRRPVALLATVAALLLTSCEPTGVTVPEGSDAAPGAVLQSTSKGEYTLVEGSIPAGVDLRVSGLIGADGGTLRLAGHTLTVPAGAVREPTTFSMALLPSGLVEVEMLAVRSDPLGGVVDVGEQGFRRPVTLSLTYSWATNVQGPGRLLIVWRKDDGTLEPLPSRVDPQTKTVTAELRHFSRYCMAIG